MKSIFIPSTEHHLTICLGIIVQKQIKNAKIIYIEDIKNSENRTFFNEFAHLKEEYGFDIFYLNFEKKKHFFPSKFISRLLDYRGRYKEIVDIIGDVPADSEFYVFADQNPHTQFIIHKYKKCEFNLAHEGFWMYVDHSLKRNNYFKKIYYKLLFGWFWKPVKTIGARAEYKALFVLYPKMIHSRYDQAKLIEIEKQNYLNDSFKEVSRSLVRQTFPQFFSLSKKDALIFFPRIMSKKEFRRIKSDLSIIFKNSEYEKIFIKHHPRSNPKLNLSTLNINEMHCVEIPNGIPAECLFVFNEEVEVKYFLPLSTLLLVAGLNSKPEQVFCIEYLMQKELIECSGENESLRMFTEKFKIPRVRKLS